MRAFLSETIEIAEIELTTRCNAACPMCARTHLAGRFPTADLTVNEVRTILPPHFVKHLRYVYLCGGLGDPINVQDMIETCRYLKGENPNIRLGVHTNGSARSPEWWAELAGVLTGPDDYVKFGIDGLADTNHLYRQRTNFDRIIENAKAFIGNGGKAHWEFLIFQHNEHQIDEARTMAQDMGFVKFTPKRTVRWFYVFHNKLVDSLDVKDAKGNVTHQIRPPANPSLQNNSVRNMDPLLEEFGDIHSYLRSTPIHCESAARRRIYISAVGNVFPCGFMADLIYTTNKQNYDQMHGILNAVGGEDAINALKKPIEHIIDGAFFQAVQERWSSDDRLRCCPRFCGKHQFKTDFGI